MANCNSSSRQEGIPLHSISEAFFSDLSSSISIAGVKSEHDYVCCVDVRQRQHHDANYVACSKAVRMSGTFELPGAVGTIFFYLFSAIVFILIAIGTTIIAIVCFRKKR